jgi:hypothetical protein
MFPGLSILNKKVNSSLCLEVLGKALSGMLSTTISTRKRMKPKTNSLRKDKNKPAPSLRALLPRQDVSFIEAQPPQEFATTETYKANTPFSGVNLDVDMTAKFHQCPNDRTTTYQIISPTMD